MYIIKRAEKYVCTPLNIVQAIPKSHSLTDQYIMFITRILFNVSKFLVERFHYILC